MELTDEELATAVREAITALNSALETARAAGLTVVAGPNATTPGEFEVRRIYRCTEF